MKKKAETDGKEFDRFDEMLRHVVSVSKDEINRREKEEKKKKKSKKKG